MACNRESTIYTKLSAEQLAILGLINKTSLATDADGNVIEGTPAVADHGALTGLTDDDHPQYAVIDNSRAQSVAGSVITYSGDFVSTIVTGGRTITYSNDGTDYTSWTDGTYTWTPTYTDGKLTSVAVT